MFRHAVRKAFGGKAGRGIGRSSLLGIFAAVEKGQVVRPGTIERRDAADPPVGVGAAPRRGPGEGRDLAYREPRPGLEEMRRAHKRSYRSAAGNVS